MGKRNKDGTFVESGNPSGRPAILPELKELAPLDKASFSRLLNEAFESSPEWSEKVMNDPNESRLRRWLHRICATGEAEGNVQKLQALLDRAIGPVKTESSMDLSMPQMNPDALIEKAMKAAMNARKSEP
jgi:hypothetical protein